MKDLENEIWKDIPEWEGYYMASNKGRIKTLSREYTDSAGRLRRVKAKIKNQCPNIHRGGYKYVALVDKLNKRKITRPTHRLVALAFLYTSKNRSLIVDHIDSDTGNNNLNNLQLVTHRQNTHKANFKGKTSKQPGVCWHKGQEKWMASITHDRQQIHIGYYKKEKDAVSAYKNKLKSLLND